MQEISFPTWNPFVLADMAKPEPLEGRGFLYVPEGARGPLPAVVVIEGLGGLKHAREFEYGDRIRDQGFVALVVDSFGPRGVADSAHNLRALKVTESQLLADAFAALRYLAAHPLVDRDAICVMGFSYGGMISVLAAYEQTRRTFVADDRLKFAGHVSYYGSSVPRLEDTTATGAPVLIFLGAKDRNVSIERTHHIAEDLRRGGAPVDLQVFPEAYHQWNSDDVTKRFVRFHIADCCMRIARDNTIRDEKTGIRVRGYASRSLALLRSVGWSGYHILQNEDVTRRTDQATWDFVRRVSARPERSRRVGQARSW